MAHKQPEIVEVYNCNLNGQTKEIACRLQQGLERNVSKCISESFTVAHYICKSKQKPHWELVSQRNYRPGSRNLTPDCRPRGKRQTKEKWMHPPSIWKKSAGSEEAGK